MIMFNVNRHVQFFMVIFIVHGYGQSILMVMFNSDVYVQFG